MKTYIIVNKTTGEKLGTMLAAENANPATLNRIVKAGYGRDAKAIEA